MISSTSIVRVPRERATRTILVTDVNDTIEGAIVELHFELRHYYFKNKNQDSFNGSIEQLEVLQPGEAPPLSDYKRKDIDPRDGPVRKNLSETCASKFIK